jgi:hypothetical protein
MTLASGVLKPLEPIAQSPLTLRGKTTEERILYTRTVYFTRKFTVLECKQLQVTEGFPERSKTRSHPQAIGADYSIKIRKRLTGNDMQGLDEEWLDFC